MSKVSKAIGGWFSRRNAGQQFGIVMLAFGFALPVIAGITVLIQYLLGGAVCDSECVNRGWTVVIAFFVGVPFGLVGLIALAISSLVSPKQHIDLVRPQDDE